MTTRRRTSVGRTTALWAIAVISMGVTLSVPSLFRAEARSDHAATAVAQPAEVDRTEP